MMRPLAVAYPDDVLRSVADRMAAHCIGMIPVLDRAEPGRFLGLVTQFDLLAARQKLLEEERHAERVLTLRRVGPKQNSVASGHQNPAAPSEDVVPMAGVGGAGQAADCKGHRRGWLTTL